MTDFNVLFVDDEPFTLRAIERLLRRQPYSKYLAESAHEALEIMAETPIHVIVSDMKMPEMDGLTLLNIVKEKYPDTVRLALSAFTHTAQLLPCINTGHLFKFIAKPLEPIDLKASILQAIEYYSLSSRKNDLVEHLIDKNRLLEEALESKREVEYKLRRMVDTDRLTGLYNNHHLHETLQKEFTQWKKTTKNCAGLAVAPDYFRKINETYGYDTGDIFLCSFAELLMTSVRGKDMCFRSWGKVFFVVLPDSGIQDALEVACKIIAAAEYIPFQIEGKQITMSVSIGATAYSVCGPSRWSDLINHAEINLHSAKDRGRNQVVA